MKIEKIEGIGPRYSNKFKELGIRTTKDLLIQGASKKGRTNIAEYTGLSERIILEWVNRADLMRIRGIGEEYSDLLDAAGVDTVKELRSRSPDKLHQALVEVNVNKKLVRRTPSLSAVKAWVAQAGLAGDPGQPAPPPPKITY